jgi:hypothetical protein
MNKEQQEILDEVYENYVNKCNEDKWMKEIILDLPFPNKSYGLYSQEEFINKCKTDTEFSERWGLKIEERELSLEERLLLADKINKEIRQDLYSYAFNNPIYTGGINQRPDDVERHHLLNDLNIPTKLITITYKEQKIESYEFWNKRMHV